jgi:uncharacterized protein
MRKIQRNSDTPQFVPDYMATSLLTIDFKELKKRGIKYIAFDADSTLVPYREIELSTETTKFLKQQKKLFTKWCIASNRVTNDLHNIAESMGVESVRAGWFSRKPKQVYFKRVMRHLGTTNPAEVAMVGDKLMADIWGGNRAGFVTVWVEHLGRDSLIDRIIRLRQLERRFMRHFL